MADEIPKESRAVLLDLLDRRRATSDATIWQVPLLTVLAQAFLLVVLGNDTIPWGARFSVLLAGLAATLAAGFTLLRGHAREVQFSEAMEVYLRQLRLPSAHPDRLPATGGEREPSEHGAVRVDRWVRGLMGRTGLLHASYWWAAALFLFLGADIIVFLATV